MTARIIAFPRRFIDVQWNDSYDVYAVLCPRCVAAYATPRETAAYDWADTHRCDPEMVALLNTTAAPTGGRAA
ncbi:hypothetical protein [Actinomadura parmotrematis]|uniref:Uncharacterized protein n=1 Tax=Actinomadura parmotrematis TaxID=2864039 RepID=A0ABS7G4U3_9ACTN|nr:hypothetical protein [Actinomadura parmotrematis]MBW8487245.1 hypothetical protein [Actinomadura parmotrematis]